VLQRRESPEWVDAALSPRGVVREIPREAWKIPEWEARVRDLASNISAGHARCRVWSTVQAELIGGKLQASFVFAFPLLAVASLDGSPALPFD
jgi:hypothetical protein